MKRLLIGALAVLMVCSLSIVGFAQTLDQDNPTGAVTIRTTYGEEDIKYAIQIPADTEIPWTAEKTSLAYVPTLMQLEAGKKVVVTVAGEHNALRLEHDAAALPAFRRCYSGFLRQAGWRGLCEGVCRQYCSCGMGCC